MRTLALIFQNQSPAAYSPTCLFIDEQRVQVLLGAALLFKPCFTAVARTKNDASSAHNPTLVFIDKLHAQQRGLDRRCNLSPNFAAVFRVQDRAALANSPSLFIVPEIDVIQGGPCS